MPAEDRVLRERELRRAVLAGEAYAWRTLYEEAFDPLYAYVSWRCGGRRDRTEDAVQETWLTAVRRMRAFDPAAGSFAAWLRGIAVNVLRNQFRRDRRHTQRTRPLDATAHGALTQPRSPLDVDAERIAAALSDLPEHYEAVLRMKYLEGMSVAAIAEARGESPKAIESLLTRARQAFRQAYLESEQAP